jgi:hypothetical protein
MYEYDNIFFASRDCSLFYSHVIIIIIYETMTSQSASRRRQIADLIHTGFEEVREGAVEKDVAPDKLRSVTEELIRTFHCMDSPHSVDLCLHKAVRFYAHLEACTDVYVYVTERDLVRRALDGAPKHAFLYKLEACLQHNFSKTEDLLTSLVLWNKEEGSTEKVTLRDFVSEEAEKLLQDEAELQSPPDVMLLRALREEEVNQKVLKQRLHEAVHRISAITNEDFIATARFMFREEYADVWSTVASRTQEGSCSGDTALWRSVVADITDDCEASRGTFSILMFFLYLEGILAVLHAKRSSARASSDRTEDAIIAAHSASVPSPTSPTAATTVCAEKDLS